MLIELAIGAATTGFGYVAYKAIRKALRKPLPEMAWSCPKCKKHSVKIAANDNSDELKFCTTEDCGWQLMKHGQPVHEVIRECPRCSGGLMLTCIAGVDEWECVGYTTRRQIIEKRGDEKLVPPGLDSLPPCGWRGLDSDYGKTWR